MAATQTVPQDIQNYNFAPIVPQHGVITLFGYGIKVNVDRGHLTIQDGIGADRREGFQPPLWRCSACATGIGLIFCMAQLLEKIP